MTSTALSKPVFENPTLRHGGKPCPPSRTRGARRPPRKRLYLGQGRPVSINHYRCMMPVHSGKLPPVLSSFWLLPSARRAAGVKVKHPPLHELPTGNGPLHRRAARPAWRMNLPPTRSNTPHSRRGSCTKGGTETST